MSDTLRGLSEFPESAELTTDESNLAQLKRILREHGAEFCTCGHEIGFGDIAWSNGNTEYGTGYSSVFVHCQQCEAELAYVQSWYPGIDNLGEVLYVLDKDWKLPA